MADDGKDQSLITLPYMVRWFSPTLLANAAVRAMVSPVFGTFADARAVQANVDGFEKHQLEDVARRHDLSEAGIADPLGVVWVDYLADTGDGFDSTYAMASLVAAERLTVSRAGSKETHTLPAGRVLIFGGDQVYPYPSRDEYQQRFVYPFEMAFSDLSLPRKAFIIPGNHDWYDGLNSFDYLFCRARYGEECSRIGSLEFRQQRSYFAVRLPYNWWIWGADLQFSDYLDAGQTRYFQTVADLMRPRDGEPEHKVILASASPGWLYEEPEARAANLNIRALADIIEGAGAKVCTVISGDTHHYSRYLARDVGLNLITAGGGGAFLHPTHHLRNDIDYRWQGTDHTFRLYCREGAGRKYEPACYPTRGQSYWLAWGNALFPIWNYTFATLLGTLYWLMTWMYSQTTIAGRENCNIGRPPLVEDILYYNSDKCGLAGESLMARISDVVTITLQASIYQFLLGIFAIMLLGSLILYADHHSRWRKFLMGFFHWLAHIIAMVALYILVKHYGYWYWAKDWTRAVFEPLLGPSYVGIRTAMFVAQMIFGGGLVAGFIWGMYLFVTCAFLRRHTNDGFSSMRLADYKNFLRMKIEQERLTIYPIGLWRSPTRLEWRKSASDPKKYVSRLPMVPELIDGPIVIEPATMPRRPANPPGTA